MQLNLRLGLIISAVAAFPALVLACWPPGYGQGGGFAAAAAVLLSAVYATRVILRGIGSPVSRMSAAVMSFRAADYRLVSPLRKDGWPEAAGLVSSLNRLMLELSAYRAFHLNQVVEERAKAQALIETISDGILLVDDRGRLIHSNKLALRVLRVAAEDQDIVFPGSVGEEAFRPVLKDILGSPENYVKAEVAVPGTDQESSVVRDFRVMSRQFLMAAFKRPGRVIVIRDVTVEKEIESARETFFHMITHDMRAPLTSIQGYAQLMEKCVPHSDKAGKYLNAIIRSSARLNGMIEDILNTIKLENGDMKLGLADVDSVSLTERVFEMYEPLAARKNIALSVASQNTQIVFPGDIRLLERVLSNLVGNSLKFTPPCGSVTLFCRREGDAAVFTVTDTGPGIPEEKHKEIFSKYSQMEEHKYMGFGLGLAMCKMAVELHGGLIWVESQEGKGSRFIFSIPIGGAHGKDIDS